ncbi:MAG: hypothetical protein CMI16_06620 [Opitutaceae bacterium]|nr:hypothetical protein [Opitutaceae bacterium]
MAKLADLELAMVRVTAGFVLFFLCVKYFMRRLNGFDVLAFVVLGIASAKPYTGQTGFILDTVAFVVVVAVVAMTAGANRRGTLFLSGLLLFSDAMVRHRQIVGQIEDMSPCTPTQIGAATQAVLFLTVGYALAGDDDAGSGFGGRSSRPDEKESEMRAWLALLVGASAVGSVLAAYGCEDSNRDGTRSLANTARVLTTAIVCFANGEDETEPNEL